MKRKILNQFKRRTRMKEKYIIFENVYQITTYFKNNSETAVRADLLEFVNLSISESSLQQ